MTKRSAVLAIAAGSAIWASPVQADTVGESVSYPSHDARIALERDEALRFFSTRGGLGPCTSSGVKVYLADSLLADDNGDGIVDRDADGGAKVGSCEITLNATRLRQRRQERRFFYRDERRESLAYDWYLVAHEVGHAIGLQHTPNGITGLMRGDLFEWAAVPGDGWAFAGRTIRKDCRAQKLRGRVPRRCKSFR